ncbi:biopolymer transporter ExbB [Pokkaliibacter plantistimulans]|uniref:Biopolymer transporter ExbB n=2 Tax=Pokkaliibacter plantistimulans TaxID=1635171 RepID=A0ABX5LX29_9GAMM|nr:MotA/TolQ/ExbB proton channel family protein [Pokkaliibacter plantistimulans]PXF31225.1 biopolymer transporter ExbB [Pokkaliibacter plantistimulans]
MLDLLIAGGWTMVPLLLCSVVALAICIERLWTLRPSRIAPAHLLSEVWDAISQHRLDNARLQQIRKNSPLGAIMAAGLLNARHGRDIMKESIEESASQVIHELERYLSTLGSIAAISPLLGLLGTVLGMIKVFTEISHAGTGNTALLAGGISEALLTTVTGLVIAIPAVFLHRMLQRRVDTLVVDMEAQAIKLVEMLHGDREHEQATEPANV